MSGCSSAVWPVSSSSSLPGLDSVSIPQVSLKPTPGGSPKPRAGILATLCNPARVFSGKAWWGACKMNVLGDLLGPHSALSSLCLLFAKEEEMGPRGTGRDSDFSLAKLPPGCGFWRLLSSVLDGVRPDLILCLLTLPQKMNPI